jgi:hypothetical protein
LKVSQVGSRYVQPRRMTQGNAKVVRSGIRRFPNRSATFVLC